MNQRLESPPMLTVATLQCRMDENHDQNADRIESWVRKAAARGAQLVVPPELFGSRYFPQTEDPSHFDQALPFENHPLITRFSAVARELGVVIPISFFERSGPHYFNSVAMVDADGAVLGRYRKSHIPDGPGYEEKFYFRPGDSGFRVWRTRAGAIGVGICWDQWFPECARAMALQGAELLVYPTAIGSEPEDPDLDSRDPWRRVMTGHAVANAIPLAAANRVGQEGRLSFFGSSFILDARGETQAELDRAEEGFCAASIDLEAARRYRASWGFFRDRRPELYGELTRIRE